MTTPQEGSSGASGPSSIRIYTRKGDDGSTGLLYGGRVPKDDPRIEACGCIDESVAALGMARSLGLQASTLKSLLLYVQRQLFVVGAELAASDQNSSRLEPGVSKVTEAMVRDLEGQIDRLVEACPLPQYFVVPGSTPGGSALDLARALVRRAERRSVVLAREGELQDWCLIRYLNRLSDLLFVAARLEEKSSGHFPEPSRTAPTD